VRLSRIEDFQVGSLVVGQMPSKCWVEPHAAETFQAAFEKKLLRAGG
jgi:hypothetical protein